MTEPALELSEIKAGYGKGLVLDGISLTLGHAERLAILGRNGVGKTTLLMTMMGLTRMAGGQIRVNGRSLVGSPPHMRARAGLGWVPQERGIFRSLSIEENLTVAARRGRWNLATIYDLFPRLQERRANLGDQLSGGEQQMLSIARALMGNPTVLLLDEPLEGLAPIIVQELTSAIIRMSRDGGTALVLIEQHAQLALSLVDKAIILEKGRIVHQGSADDLRKDPATLGRYIGLELTTGDTADAKAGRL